MSRLPLAGRRVVHWAKFYPPHRGGMESVAAALAQAACQDGASVEVVAFDPARRPAAAPPADGLPAPRVLRCPVRWALASQPLSWRYLWRAWRTARQASLVHLHAPNMLALLPALLLPRQGPGRVPLVVHWHSDVVDKGWLGRLVAPLERALLRRADRVIVTSAPYAQGSLRLRQVRGLRERQRVVPIGVAAPGAGRASPDPGDGAATLAGVQDWLAGRRLLLALGRLVPYKGFEVLLQALTRVDPRAALVLVGQGPQADALQAQVQALGLADRVRLLPEVDDAGRDALLSAAQVFCLPSVARAEAFGVVLVEAMAHGVPVVATHIPGSGVPWVNQHMVSGLNVPPGDAAALAAALNQLLADEPLRRHLAQGARQRHQEAFSQARAWAATLAVYREVLPENAGIRPVLPA
ncbi:glycosyltransferase [Ideonella livida]|uniref:Glycosyltransferase n=1 Tax=Ideonella livida TaxID=2707176 RepID=A0A7C9TLB6_9BURK|nr:glycosyltransferase [Ideonella livida]NDY93419.1 glycosyltransferase [Ideonella livida]